MGGGKKKRHSNDLQQKKNPNNLISWFRDAGKPQSSAQTDSLIHTKGTTNSRRHHPSLGHKQAVSLGNTSKCLFGWGCYWWGINENHTPQFTSNSWIAGFCQECCRHNRKVKHHIKNKPSPPTNPYSPKVSSSLFSSYSCNTKLPFPVCPVYLLMSPIRIYFPSLMSWLTYKPNAEFGLQWLKGAFPTGKMPSPPQLSTATRTAVEVSMDHALQNMWPVIFQAFLPSPSII